MQRVVRIHGAVAARLSLLRIGNDVRVNPGYVFIQEMRMNTGDHDLGRRKFLTACRFNSESSAALDDDATYIHSRAEVPPMMNDAACQCVRQRATATDWESAVIGMHKTNKHVKNQPGTLRLRS